MGLDFWAVKIKKGVTEANLKDGNCWDLVEDAEINNYIKQDISEFELNQNDKDLYRLCEDTVGFFVGGDPIYIKSQEDINILADKLNEFIKENLNYEYNYGDNVVYSNEEVKNFIKYVNLVRDNGFVLWCSW